MDDDALRGLADWVTDWDGLKPIEAKIKETWTALKELRSQHAEARVILSRTCPLELTALEARFWSKVKIIDDDDSCWVFTGARRPVKGEEYGIFRIDGDDSKGTIGAHRFAYVLANGGAIPDHARHTCDNPPCCRPKHLLDGTHADNMADKKARGRGRTKSDQRGEANDSAVLTDAIVLDARRRSKAGETQKVIADSYGVSTAIIGFAVRGQTWNHLDEIEAPHVRRAGGGTHLTEDAIRDIRTTFAKATTWKERGDTKRELAVRYGMTVANVATIITRKSWAHIE
jgi:hypothetical protein